MELFSYLVALGNKLRKRSRLMNLRPWSFLTIMHVQDNRGRAIGLIVFIKLCGFRIDELCTLTVVRNNVNSEMPVLKLYCTQKTPEGVVKGKCTVWNQVQEFENARLMRLNPIPWRKRKKSCQWSSGRRGKKVEESVGAQTEMSEVELGCNTCQQAFGNTTDPRFWKQTQFNSRSI